MIDRDAHMERLHIAQWILERNLAWIGAAEVKIGVIVALDTAMLGGLATALSATPPDGRTAWAYLCTALATAALGIGVIRAWQVVAPALTGPKSSMIFFGRIAEHRKDSDYAERFRESTFAELLDDCLAQIHRNAEIARDKFKCVRGSMRWSFIAIAPWVAALAALIKA